MGASYRLSDTLPLVSVIVPIYNVESYLHRCMDSILGQTYESLEIIMVDDGSPDGCPAICDEYAIKDARVKVIHKQNGGLSDARNAGMARATGEYLMFVDSDDWLETCAVETLYRLSKEYDAQLVIGGMRRVEDGTDRILQSDWNGLQKNICMTPVQAIMDFFQNGCAAWGRLYCRKVHDGIEFPSGEINEDEAIVLQILERCNTIVETNMVIYNYRFRPQSITTSSFSEKKLSWYRHCVDNLAWVRQYHPEQEAYAADRLCESILWSLTEIALTENYASAWVKELKRCLRKNYPELKKAYHHGTKQTIRLLALRYLPFALYRTAIRKKRGV